VSDPVDDVERLPREQWLEEGLEEVGDVVAHPPDEGSAERLAHQDAQPRVVGAVAVEEAVLTKVGRGARTELELQVLPGHSMHESAIA